VHGFPAKPGDGWVGDPRTWTLDVGALGAQVYLGGVNPPAPKASVDVMPAARAAYPGWGRSWISFEIGPEQMGANTLNVWEVSEWDVQVQE